MRSPFRLVPAAAAACLMSACGGGGGSPPDSGTPPVTSSSGVAVDGYLQFATVVCDSNDDGVVDAGERGAGTSGSGRFAFSPACDAPLIVFGGTNADTGLPFGGRLRAPAGASVVSPLTTLLAEGLAAPELLASLALPADTLLASTDPAALGGGVLVEPALYRATLAVQQVLQSTTMLLARLAGQDGADAVQTVYARVARSTAAALAGSSPLSDGTTFDPAVVGRIVEDAVAAVTATYPFTAAVDAASLAQVVSAALGVQASRILVADESQLAATVSAGQLSTEVADFVEMHRAELSGAPGEGTAALALALTALVDPYVSLAADELVLVNGAGRTGFTLSQFASNDGIRVSWPLAEPVMLEMTLANAAHYMPPGGQKLSAAVSITETEPGGHGQILAYIDDVDVTRAGDALKLSVPATASAKVYGVSSDGRKKAVVDFRNGVRGVTGTFDAGGQATSFPVGNIVNYAINLLSNDFTGIYALRGRYRVSLVLSGVEMRLDDGTALPVSSLTVPTAIDGSGAVTTSRTVQGRGLTGYLTLVD